MDTSTVQRGNGEGRGSATGKRQYRSIEVKRQIVEETFKAGTSVAVVARRHGVNANQVFSWRRQYERGELVTAIRDAREVPLLPVKIDQPAAPPTAEGLGTDASSAEDCLEIEFSDGRHIRVWGRADPEALRTAIRELSRS